MELSEVVVSTIGLTAAVVATLFAVKLTYHQELNDTIDKCQPRSNRTLRPTSLDELRQTVIEAGKQGNKLSIRGAGKSTGGQTYSSDSLTVDLSNLNGIGVIVGMTVRVGAGLTWGQLLSYLSPQGYSVRAMQSFCDFSIGGSVSVNCHGQDLDYNPIYDTIVSLSVMVASGKVIELYPDDELFRYVVGGYGLIGIVVEVRLKLTNNVRLIKTVSQCGVDTISVGSNVIFSSLRVDCDTFTTGLQINLSSTTNQERIKEEFTMESSSIGTMLGLMSNYPVLRSLRAEYEMGYERTTITTTRNQHLSNLTSNLSSNVYPTSNYILQEYFVPLYRLQLFLSKLKGIVTDYRVNLLNATVRYVNGSESVLGYVPHGVIMFAIVLYIDLDKFRPYSETFVWTRAIIDLAIELRGSYYLPYQLLASEDQFQACYPNYRKFIAMKKRVDPDEMFTSNLYKFMCRCDGGKLTEK